MIYFGLFLIELIFLFLLSKHLINALAQLLFRLTHNHHTVVNILAILFLPGTIIHELAHLLFAGMMLVPVGEMKVVPEIEEKGVKLGSVQIGKSDLLRRTIIGVAPVLFGLFCMFAVFLFIPVGQGNIPWWQIALALYLIFEIGNTMFSSNKDIEGMIGFVLAVTIVAAVVLAALYVLNPTILQSIWLNISNLNFSFAVEFLKSADLYLAVPIALDILITIITRVVINIS